MTYALLATMRQRLHIRLVAKVRFTLTARSIQRQKVSKSMSHIRLRWYDLSKAH